MPLVVPNDYFYLLLIIMALNAMVVLGLNLLVGATGQVSLGHAAFYGLGAYLSAIASTTWQWPLPAALVFSLACTALTAFLLALPTLRLEGHYLVMATLGFNIIVSILLGQMENLTGGPSGFPGIPKLAMGSLVLGSDRSFYCFVWGLFLVLLALTLNLTDGRIGRAFTAIHEKDLTAQALGIATFRTKVAVFVLSALYAALAGFCYAHYVTFISPKTFDIFYSVQVVTMVAVGGMGNLWGGLAAAVLLTGLPHLLHHFEDLHVLLYGLILMGVLVFCPQGLLAVLASCVPRKLLPRPVEALPRGAGILTARECLNGVPPPAAEPHAQLAPGLPRAPGENSAVLEMNRISLSFGGLQALSEVDLDLHSGEIVGLIGPNGAGKTTLLNVISGILQPEQGEAFLNGQPFLGLPAHEIARLGLGRTFQAAQVFPHLSVLENVLLGYHVHGRKGMVAACLHSPAERKEEAWLRREATALLDGFGLGWKARREGQQLSLIDQKLLELARALALKPSVLLLDEPVGGLNPRESEVLVEHVAHLRRGGMGIILVEHDMNVLMRLADRVVVLQHGQRIASGTPREIQSNPRVISAYLGTRSRRF
jgi:branched-chain amino acid transport system permease protein